MKDIKVEDETWRELMKMKIAKGFKNMNQLVKFLLKNKSI
jgi:predicted CopG family antitoxin